MCECHPLSPDAASPRIWDVPESGALALANIRMTDNPSPIGASTPPICPSFLRQPAPGHSAAPQQQTQYHNTAYKLSWSPSQPCPRLTAGKLLSSADRLERRCWAWNLQIAFSGAMMPMRLGTWASSTACCLPIPFNNMFGFSTMLEV